MLVIRESVIVLAALLLCACSNTLVARSAGIERGMSKSTVLQVMGPPANKQFHDADEAWQYCNHGATSVAFLTVWFFDGAVTGLTQWTDNTPSFDCTTRLGAVSWLDAPSHVTRGRVAPEPPAAEANGPIISSGTGFLVDGNGTIVTSAHVVIGKTQIQVRCGTRKPMPATLEASSASTDVAILSTGMRDTAFLTLSRPRSAKVGQRIFTYGFPVADLLGAEPKFTDGTISSLSGLGGEQAYLQISVPVQPGNSGGPVVGEDAEVVGIVAAQAAIEPFLRNTGTLPQNVNWAVKSEYAALLFDAPAPQTPARDRDDAIARVAECICFIEAQ